jgi:hypothetical protein
MSHDFDRRKSLQELENDDWGEPTFNSSLVVNCHRLRRVPLEELTPGDCRLLLRQNIGARFLVPITLKWLVENPLLKASFYPGDLLKIVLQLESSFWEEHEDLWWQVYELFDEIENLQRMMKTFRRSSPLLRNEKIHRSYAQLRRANRTKSRCDFSRFRYSARAVALDRRSRRISERTIDRPTLGSLLRFARWPLRRTRARQTDVARPARFPDEREFGRLTSRRTTHLGFSQNDGTVELETSRRSNRIQTRS